MNSLIKILVVGGLLPLLSINADLAVAQTGASNQNLERINIRCRQHNKPRFIEARGSSWCAMGSSRDCADIKAVAAARACAMSDRRLTALSDAPSATSTPQNPTTSPAPVELTEAQKRRELEDELLDLQEQLVVLRSRQLRLRKRELELNTRLNN